MTVFILAGTTSLGTVGAAEWVTNGELAAAVQKACDRLGRTLREDTELEAVLKITAEVRSPARPWAVLGRTPQKLFLGNSINAVGDPPSRITLITRGGEPDSLMLDDDEVRFRGKDYSALVTICRVACAQTSTRPRGIIDLRELVADEAVVSELGGHTDIADLEIYLRDHLQNEHCLGSTAVSIEKGTLKFRCEIRHIDHSHVSPA